MSFILCGLLTGALCFAELGAMIQESGAEYAYMKRTFGNGVAFTYSWTYCLLVKPCSLAIVIITCAQYLTVPFFDDDCGDPPKTIIILTGITVISKFTISLTLKYFLLAMLLCLV